MVKKFCHGPWSISYLVLCFIFVAKEKNNFNMMSLNVDVLQDYIIMRGFPVLTVTKSYKTIRLLQQTLKYASNYDLNKHLIKWLKTV